MNPAKALCVFCRVLHFSLYSFSPAPFGGPVAKKMLNREIALDARITLLMTPKIIVFVPVNMYT